MEWNNNLEGVKPEDSIAEWVGDIWIEIEPGVWRLKEVYVENKKEPHN